MAVDTIWAGGVSGDFSVAGNWSAGVPIADKVAVITGTVSIDAGLAQGALELATIYVAPTYSGNIGGTGSYLACQTDLLVDRGSGNTWFRTDSAAALTALVIVDKPSGTIYLDNDGTSDFTRIVVLRGNVVIAGTATVTIPDLDITYRNNPETDSKVTITAGCGITALVRMNGGRLVSAAVITDLHLDGGVVDQTTAAITNLFLTGGTCNYKTSEIMAAAHCMRGRLDLMQDSSFKTITELWQFPGADVVRDPDLTTIGTEHSFGDLNL